MVKDCNIHSLFFNRKFSQICTQKYIHIYADKAHSRHTVRFIYNTGVYFYYFKSVCRQISMFICKHVIFRLYGYINYVVNSLIIQIIPFHHCYCNKRIFNQIRFWKKTRHPRIFQAIISISELYKTYV